MGWVAFDAVRGYGGAVDDYPLLSGDGGFEEAELKDFWHSAESGACLGGSGGLCGAEGGDHAGAGGGDRVCGGGVSGIDAVFSEAGASLRPSYQGHWAVFGSGML